jgi:hypothetical protein
VDIRITPFSTLRSQPKTNLADNRNRFTDFNKSPATKSRQLLLSTNKTPTKNLNNILVLSKKTTVARPIAVADKKGLLLYQQIERNKLFSNGTELINRLQLKT